MEIVKMFKEQNEIWKEKNIDLFGVEPLDVDNLAFADLQANIDNSVAKYWNVEESKQCKLCKLILSNKLSRDSELLTPNSFKLELNPGNMCIDVEGEFNVENKKIIKKIAAIPTPAVGLNWIINGTKYVPRVTASRDREMVMKVNYDPNRVVGHFWTYDIQKKKFGCLLKKDPFEVTPEYVVNNLSPRSRALLEATLGEKVTKKNLIEALEKMPTFKSNSIFNYAFYHLEYFENLLTNPDAKKFANPLKNIILGINMMFLKQADDNITMAGQLVISKSPIFALENFRTTVNKYVSKNAFIPSFTYCDTIGFFDAFKTTTSRSAGRQRLLVDEAIVKDGMIWIKEDDGKYHNMYEYMKEPSKYRLSCISHSLFCNNNKAKRIMMTAKLTAQAVPVVGEKDEFTHRIPARVVFADIEGYTYADAILISESFAERLKSHDKVQLIIDHSQKYTELLDKYLIDPDHKLSFDELVLLFPSVSEVILKNYRNATISKIDKMSDKRTRLFVEYDIPFGLGDKISNLHGAKGVVGKIVPDDEMPYLKNKVGNMEPGPMEVVISSFSTIRRGSLGQIFEAWAGATGHEFNNNDDFINLAVQKYEKEMKDFSDKSILSYKGQDINKPIGVIDMIRLYHHASTHASKSWIKSNHNKMLKFGEMEKLNLMANECTNILKELSIRSTHKHIGAYGLIMGIEKDRELPENPQLSLKFARMMKSIGYDILLNNKPLVATDNNKAIINSAISLDNMSDKTKKKIESGKLSVDDVIMNSIMSEDKIDLYNLADKIDKEDISNIDKKDNNINIEGADEADSEDVSSLENNENNGEE